MASSPSSLTWFAFALLLVVSLGDASTLDVRCKLVLVERSPLVKHPSFAGSIVQKLFHTPPPPPPPPHTSASSNNSRVQMLSSPHVITKHDCLDASGSGSAALANRSLLLYGLDLASNGLDDGQLRAFFDTRIAPALGKQRRADIRFLNLSANSLVSLGDNNNDDNDNNDNDDSSYSLLARLFVNLQVLVLDDNERLSARALRGRTFRSLMRKLRVLSVNRCGLGDDDKSSSSSLPLGVVGESKLIYLGVSGNRLSDGLGGGVEHLLRATAAIDTLDLSANELTSVRGGLSVLRAIHVTRLNLEANRIRDFDLTELSSSPLSSSLVEINLRHNLITSTDVRRYSLTHTSAGGSLSKQLALKLAGNPLICDCNSAWLLELVAKWKPSIKSAAAAARRRSRREMEKISPHHTFDDPNMVDEQMQRKKRPDAAANASVVVRLADLDAITCRFVDVQNRPNRTSHAERLLSAYSARRPLNNNDEDLELASGRQNWFAGAIDANSGSGLVKRVMASVSGDYVCAYADHCDARTCDCCAFTHCSCRSTCPSRCRCFIESTTSSNIIDCSSLELAEMDATATPIESATDVRLSRNRLHIVKPHTFFGYAQLKYLYLQANAIGYLTSEAFDDVRYTLRLLNLAHNQLSYLNGDEFNNLDELRVLVLANNPLKDIDNIYFVDVKYMPVLRVLDVSETRLAPARLAELAHYSDEHTNATVVVATSSSASSAAAATTSATIPSRGSIKTAPPSKTPSTTISLWRTSSNSVIAVKLSSSPPPPPPNRMSYGLIKSDEDATPAPLVDIENSQMATTPDTDDDDDTDDEDDEDDEDDDDDDDDELKNIYNRHSALEPSDSDILVESSLASFSSSSSLQHHHHHHPATTSSTGRPSSSSYHGDHEHDDDGQSRDSAASGSGGLSSMPSNLMHWHYLSVGIILTCLFVSLLAMLTIVVVARNSRYFNPDRKRRAPPPMSDGGARHWWRRCWRRSLVTHRCPPTSASVDRRRHHHHHHHPHHHLHQHHNNTDMSSASSSSYFVPHSAQSILSTSNMIGLAPAAGGVYHHINMQPAPLLSRQHRIDLGDDLALAAAAAAAASSGDNMNGVDDYAYVVDTSVPPPPPHQQQQAVYHHPHPLLAKLNGCLLQRSGAVNGHAKTTTTTTTGSQTSSESSASESSDDDDDDDGADAEERCCMGDAVASVPVSRAIHSLALHVYVYHHVLDEGYVRDSLLPVLKRCSVLVPDTKYIARPQTSVYIDTSAYETTHSSSSSVIAASILIMSDSFFGYAPPAYAKHVDQNNNNNNNNNNHSNNSNKRSNNNNNKSNTSTSSTSSSSGATMATTTTTATSNSITATSKRSYKRLKSATDACFKRAFKIYINNNNNNNNNGGGDVGLTTPPAAAAARMSMIVHPGQPGYASLLGGGGCDVATSSSGGGALTLNRFLEAARNHSLIGLLAGGGGGMDAFSSFGGDQKLQVKLERFVENICLKSAKMANTNFSYVDYSKR